MKPKVSVILPIYCVEKFLERCLKSVTEQTLRDIEIILVDDGSLDNCPVMCDNYGKLDRRIKVIHKKNEGLGYARNTGLDYATGEYVAFIDSDDFIDINMMNQLYTYAYKYDLDAVFCGMKFVDAHGNITMDRKEVNEYIEMKGNECRQHVLDLIASREKSRVSSKYMMSVWHAIYHKEFLDKHNIRFCSERDFISEDMIFDIDFFSVANKVGFIPDSFYYYCFNENSLSRKFNINLYDRFKKHYFEVVRRLSNLGYSSTEICIAHKYILVKTRSYIRDLYRYEKADKLKLGINNVLSDSKIWKEISDSDVFKYLSRSYKLYLFVLTFKCKSVLLLIEKCEKIVGLFKNI